VSLALELVDIRKQFGAVVALASGTLRVREGTVHALVGENGAGKTTLVRIAAGELRPDGGLVKIAQQERTLRGSGDALGYGIGMVHQHFAIVPSMTVAENIALATPGRFDPRRGAEHVRSLARETGLEISAGALVRDLPVAAQQRVEILKALSRRTRLLIFDEPTAVLAPDESEGLFAWMRQFVERGSAVVFITHRLAEARRVADEVTVLRGGRTVATHQMHEVSDRTLVEEMIGQAVSEPASGAMPAVGEVVISLTDVSVRGERKEPVLHDVSMSVRAGEIVGIAAIEGAGQRELLRILSGRLSPDQGRCIVPRDVGFIPEDRHRDALVLDMSLAENVALRGLAARRGLLDWREVSRSSELLLQGFDVRATSVDVRAATLSGGNQQKLVVGREMVPAPTALVAENPTRGLDVRAGIAIRQGLRASRDNGLAVVIYSADIDEVIALADRVLVVYAGTVHQVPKVRDAIGRAMMGLAA
jgi:general nucleoside transport system ATP-binding protein